MRDTLYKNANLSRCGTYRYTLWRVWDDSLPYVNFIGLNPSTADATLDDPTLRRCMDFARRWGFGGSCTTNLFAYRATQPKALKTASDPVGPANNRWIRKISSTAGLVLVAWGNHGSFLHRDKQVLAMLPEPLHCLKVSATGHPAHPLYQQKTCSPIPYPGSDISGLSVANKSESGYDAPVLMQLKRGTVCASPSLTP